MKKNKSAKKLSLSKETLAVLDPKNLAAIGAQAITTRPTFCGESIIICSVIHTCVSCQDDTTNTILA